MMMHECRGRTGGTHVLRISSLCQRGRGTMEAYSACPLTGSVPRATCYPLRVETELPCPLPLPLASPLPGFWAGVGRNSRTLLLQTNFGRWVGTCSQATQLSRAGAGGGVSTGQKGVKGPGVSGLGLGRVGQGWPLKRERPQPYLR